MNPTVNQQKELSLKNACVKFLFAYQQRNVEKMLSYCAPAGTIHFEPLGAEGKGNIHELGKGLWTALIDSFPNLDNTVDAAVAEDEQTVRCQVVIRGTQEKDFAGISSKGRSFDSDHIFIFRVDPNNKISHIQVSWDHTDFQRQLGAL